MERKGKGERVPPPLPPFERREEWGKEGGGIRERGEGEHTQTEPCLTSSLWTEEGVIQSQFGQAEEKKRGKEEGGMGTREWLQKGWKRCTRAASVLVREEQKTLCPWMGAGELRHKASAMRNQADFSHWCCWAPILSLSVSPLSLPASSDSALVWFRGRLWGAFWLGFWALCFRNMLLRWI